MNLRSNIALRGNKKQGFRYLAVAFAVALLFGMVKPAHAAISYRTASSASNAGGATSVTITTPAGAAVGDVLIASVDFRANTADYNANPASGSGTWTLLQNSFSAGLIKQTYRSVLTAAPPSSYTFNLVDLGDVAFTAKATIGMIAYSGVDTTNPVITSAQGANAASTTATAPSVTTAVNNAMIVALYGAPTATTATQGSSMTERFDVQSSGGGGATTKATSAGQDAIQAASGASGTKIMTWAVSTASIGHTVALRPAPPSTLTQTAYRWFNNVDAANFSTVTNNPTTGTDAIYAAINDSSFIYTTGYISTGANNWRIEKRNLSDGALVTGFGTSGVVDVAVSANDDRAWGIDQDASYIYVAGQDATVSNTNIQWRIEKRDKTTGALVTGFGTGGVVQNNPTAGIDTPKEVKVDDSFIYIAGGDNTGAGAWRIEKRDKTTGALVTGFGTGGAIVTDFVATENEQIAAMVLDTDNIYVGGYDYSSGSTLNSQSRIEKRDKTTGALVTGFGTSGAVVENPFTGNSSSTVDDGVVHKGLLISGGNLYTTASEGVTGSTDFQWRITKRDITTGALVTGFGTSGVVNVNPSTAIDNPTSIRTDGTSLFIAGFDRSLDAGFSQWRIEKRDMTSGALVTGFGTSGVITINPSTNHDELRDIVVLGSNVFAAGYDSAPGNIQTRIEKRNTLNGSGPGDNASPRAAQDTAATLVMPDEKIRLRLLLKVGTSLMDPSDQQFKLQFATRSGTCDAAFSGETYADVTTTTAISYWNNTALTDASTTYFNISDPADGVNPVILQTYEEANNFTNTVSAIPVGSNGLWDVSLYNLSAPAETTYCFRVVDSAGSVLSAYTSMPTLTTAPSYAIEQGNYRWFQNTDSTAPGTTLAAQNTAASVAAGSPFRLRQLLNQMYGTMTASTGFKMQSGEKLSTCSAATYADIGPPVGFQNNATPLDNATISSTANDPIPGSGSVVYQTYNEDGALTNPTAVTAGNSGLWDFSLTTEANANGKTFCFRVVNSDGSPLYSYAQYPEMTFSIAVPTLDQQTRGGQSVIGGQKTPFSF